MRASDSEAMHSCREQQFYVSLKLTIDWSINDGCPLGVISKITTEILLTLLRHGGFRKTEAN